MTIVVVGDVMLDVFEEGRVERISPEAPVPVLRNPRGHDGLGGAANTARNVHELGCTATLVGLIGSDAAGDRCRLLTVDHGIVDALVTVPDWRTVIKHRFMAGGQQILRVDTEDLLPAGAAALLCDDLPEHFAGASALVLSDYDKGVMTDAVARTSIRLANDASIPVIVDTKRIDPSVFTGCTVLAPNRMEATRMSGATDPAVAAERIAGITGSAVVVTLGADGLLVFDAGAVEYIHSQARDVADVTGAGDSVTAGLAVALVEGASLGEAARFAAEVAAVAVAHSGTYAVKRADLS